MRPRLQALMGEFEQALREAQAGREPRCAGTCG